MFFFTSDEHYGHYNVIKYCNRPFSSTIEMDEELIRRHNEKVKSTDIVIHAGDFSLSKTEFVNRHYVSKLNGTHVFLRGSHDKWLDKKAPYIFEKMIDKQYVVVCHYAMRVWPRRHYGSWMLYGHSHGNLLPVGKQHDIGVDNNNFYPLSFDEIRVIMDSKHENIMKEGVDDFDIE